MLGEHLSGQEHFPNQGHGGTPWMALGNRTDSLKTNKTPTGDVTRQASTNDLQSKPWFTNTLWVD